MRDAILLAALAAVCLAVIQHVTGFSVVGGLLAFRRGLRRACQAPARYRTSAALDADPELARRREIAEVALQVAEILGEIPQADHAAVLAEAAYLVHLDPAAERALEAAAAASMAEEGERYAPGLGGAPEPSTAR